MGVRSEDWVKARALLDPQIRVVELASDDAWIRDTGPTFIVKDEGDSREVRGVDWGFNAYGALYGPYVQDELVARKVLEVEGARRYRAPLVMEGGSFHVDGEGTCLVREGQGWSTSCGVGDASNHLTMDGRINHHHPLFSSNGSSGDGGVPAAPVPESGPGQGGDRSAPQGVPQRRQGEWILSSTGPPAPTRR